MATNNEAEAVYNVMTQIGEILRENSDALSYETMVYILGHLISSGCMATDDPNAAFQMVGAAARHLMTDPANRQRMERIKQRYCN